MGDGAVGLCAVLAAHRAGVERVLLLGHHERRLEIGRNFGATDLVVARGPEAHDQIIDITGGVGADLVVEAVGEQDAITTAAAVCAPGGVVSMVGGPHGELDLFGCFLRNVTLTGGLAPVRRYLPESTLPLPDIDRGYRAVLDRRATKVLVTA
ncbi:zinc-binding dehydrogenase [Actinophytocola gossypii]|uniref:zinc-binding dehydrogenase n=1 Tax=Actinophytocola gossypii TaxID=2812003 RepID=UPI0021A62EF7|nr:zinc-binding dehydrogenase [Actinophytocola gossypii]